jgi:hypothetical protein
MKMTRLQGEDGKPSTRFAFFCPACQYGHWIDTAPGRWTFNGDMEKPTISPSVLTVGIEPRCHSFVRDGKIQFLGDCTHKMAGQTVDLPDWED